MNDLDPPPELFSTISSIIAIGCDTTRQSARQALNAVRGNAEDARDLLEAPPGTVTTLQIDKSTRKNSKRNIYMECLEVTCPYLQPIEINLAALCNEIECSEMFTRIEDDILGDLPPDCDFSIIFNEVVKCCQKFLTFISSTEYFNKSQLIDYVICNHDGNEVSYEVFLSEFFNKVLNILDLESYSFDDCQQSDMIAIRHGLHNLGLLQQFLECYATPIDHLEPIISKLLHDVIVNQTLMVFDVGNALYGNRVLYETTRACVFKNTYNLCTARGVRFSHTLLQCFLKEFFEQYNRLRDFIFTDQRSLLCVVSHGTGRNDEAFKTFVGVIIDGLACERSENRLFYADFLWWYTQRVNPSFACRSRERYLLRELTQAMKIYSYESKPLDAVFCHFLRYELGAMALDKVLIQDFLQLHIERRSDLTLTINNQQGRYIVEVALLVIRGIMLEIQTARQNRNDSRAISMRSQLFLFLELIDRTHVQYFLAFDYHDINDASSDYFDEQNSTLLNDTLCQLYSQNPAALEIGAKLHFDGDRSRSRMCLLHSWVFAHAKDFRNAISTELTTLQDDQQIACEWYILFISIFDHIKKFGATWSDGLKITHPTQEVLDSLFKSFSHLRAEINPAGFRVRHALKFYNTVLDILSKQIKLLLKTVNLDEGLKILIRQTTSLRLALSRTRNLDMVNWIDYNNVELTAINVIMNDDWISNVRICGEQANEFLLEKIVNVSAIDSGLRLGIYGQSILAIKSRFNVSTDAFQKHVKDLNECADKDVFLRDYPGLSTDGAILALLGILVKSQLENLSLVNLAEVERCRSLESFFHRFDSLAERKIASYKFSLNDMWNAFCEQNGNIPDDIKQQNGKSVEEFKRELNAVFDGKFPGEINNFENNQVVALHVVQRLFDLRISDKAAIFRIGTGQGKTLTEAAVAVNFLRNNRSSGQKGKVIILTAFSHLAKRDKAAMDNMYRQFGFNAILLDSVQDAASFQMDGSDIIYADSEALIDCVVRNSISAVPNPDLLEFALGNWSHHLLVLDEVDVLLKKSETRYVYDCFRFFREPDLKAALTAGKYKTITTTLNAEPQVVAKLSSTNHDTKVTQNEANLVVSYVADLGAQIKVGNLSLYGACFSWKAKLQSMGRNVIGFSGTVDPHTFGRTCAPFFDGETNPFCFFKVPLFFSPGRQYGDVTCRRLLAESDQLTWMNAACERGEVPPVSNQQWKKSLPLQAWIDTIKMDCDEAKAKGQAVLIFAYIDATNSPTCDFRLLQTSLGADKSYNNDSTPSDGELQSVATPGCVTLCCKKIGRGADVRVSPTMQEGLHVIMASPDYMEEMMQQIGRTGRMNRKGSYSFIFKSDSIEPSYGTPEEREQINILKFGMRLSHEFFSSQQLDKRNYFFWLIYVLITWGRWCTFNNKSKEESKQIKDNIKRLLSSTVLG